MWSLMILVIYVRILAKQNTCVRIKKNAKNIRNYQEIKKGFSTLYLVHQ